VAPVPAETSPAAEPIAAPGPETAMPGPVGTLGPGQASSPALRPGLVLGLQRAAGNAAVRGLVGGGPASRASAAVQREVSPSQAEGIAGQLHEAMAGWGTDEEAIYGALSGRTREDLDLIRTAYARVSSAGLDADLQDELTVDEMARVTRLMATGAAPAAGAAPATGEERAAARENRARDVAGQLRDAMAGWGTAESQIFNALTGRTPHEIVQIAGEYQLLTGHGLLADLRDELSGDDLEGAVGLVRVMHAEGAGPDPEIAMLQQALNVMGAVPAIRITGMLGPETTAALGDFQRANPPLRADGAATLETWLLLDDLAPRVFRQGVGVVETKTPAEPRGVPLSGSIHPTVRLGSRGAAVEELQQKLLTIAAGQVPTRPTANGSFTAATRNAVREFQGSRTPPLPVDGAAGPATWAALDAVAGPVTVGREDFAWRERTEGMIFGASSRFTWRLLPDKLQVTVNIRFTGAPNHPKVAGWRSDIRNVWNGFRMVDDDHPGTSLGLEFIVGTGAPVDATVRVRVEAPDVAQPGRSDAGNWYTSDADHGMAPHEFGHLIGLRDEYNQGPEALAAVTGEEAFAGQLEAPTGADGSPVAPGTIAAEMRAAVTSSPANRRGGKAKAVIDRYRLQQGGFAQRVSAAYEAAYAGALLREDFGPVGGYHSVVDPSGTMANDIAARIPRDSDDGEWAATGAFLYSNRSLMGTMASLSAPIGQHDHPVAERHVRHFAEIVGRNRPGTWRVVR
jgi:peptidoglycan hydrolase-like protein with peptidoglycan-binding domain